jgi:dCMP deaminase
MKHRPSWEEYALNLARGASSRSEDPYSKVGACALDYNNRVLGVAYNGLVSKTTVSTSFWHDRDKRRPYMIHAEQNLLSLFKKGEAKILACTLLPCSDCARLICSWEIPLVVYLHDYQRDLSALDIFKFYKTKLKKISFL